MLEIHILQICVDLPYSMSPFCINEYSVMHIGTQMADTDLLTSKYFVSWQ